MSLILDALNRSREDTGQIPGLATQHYLEDAPERGNRYQTLMVMALLAALLVIGWLLWEKKSEPAATVSEAVRVVAAPAREQAEPLMAELAAGDRVPPAPAPIDPAPVDPVSSGPERVAPERVAPDRVTPDRVASDGENSSVAELYRQQQPGGSEPAAPSPEPRATQVKPQEKPGAQPAREASAETETTREEQPLDIEQLVAQAEDEIDNARLEEHQVPFLATLSQQTKDGIPTIMYQRHDYSGNAAKSTVVLNGKPLRTGATAAGLKVEEILPDSVVLNYQGTRFRLRALNSWVNL